MLTALTTVDQVVDASPEALLAELDAGRQSGGGTDPDSLPGPQTDFLHHRPGHRDRGDDQCPFRAVRAVALR
jgi:hypothetical protein